MSAASNLQNPIISTLHNIGVTSSLWHACLSAWRPRIWAQVFRLVQQVPIETSHQPLVQNLCSFFSVGKKCPCVWSHAVAMKGPVCVRGPFSCLYICPYVPSLPFHSFPVFQFQLSMGKKVSCWRFLPQFVLLCALCVHVGAWMSMCVEPEVLL